MRLIVKSVMAVRSLLLDTMVEAAECDNLRKDAELDAINLA